MTAPRTVVLTSAAGGVGTAVQQAADVSAHAYTVIGLSSEPAHLLSGAPALACPPTRDRVRFSERVLALVERAGPCLVVPGRDEDAVVLCERAAELAPLGASLTSGPGPAVRQAYDKALTPALLAGSALSMARTAATLPDALAVAEQVGYPLLIKPRRGNASRGVRLAHGNGELRRLFVPLQDVAQELLPLVPDDRRPWDHHGDERAQVGEYSLQFLIGPAGDDLGCFASRNNLSGGTPRLVEVVDARTLGIGTRAHEALTRSGAWGAWNLQGRLAPCGTLRFFEINARPTGLTGLRARLGFNELDRLYEACVLRRLPPPARPPVPGQVIDISGPQGDAGPLLRRRGEETS
ncbi:ATP-binding protein [Streptomyces cadmiisoli]|uniref:ATP-binding protein n=1 Tax=Streptomyces cadmiisoli TaxID=2184053 RepID=UPI0036556C64